MNKLLILFLVLFLYSDYQSVSVNNVSVDKTEKDVRYIIKKNAAWLLSHKEIHSTSIGIYKDGKSYIEHFGELDRGKGNTPNNNTIYEIASISKTFTGTLLAQAVLDGKLSLDDDIRKYLDKEFPNLEFNGLPITIKHLIAHTAGLPREFPDRPDLWENPNFDTLPYKLIELSKDYNKTKFFSDLHKVKIKNKPGSKYLYSNVGPNLIAHILENIYKKSFDELLQEVIFRKAGMTSTKFKLDSREKNRFANGYNDKGKLMPRSIYPFWGAAGGYKSTLPDLMKYLEFQFSNDNPVLKRSYESNDGTGSSYHSYSWRVRLQKDGSRRVTAHGGTFGMQTWIAYYPKLKTGIVVITNESDQNTGPRIGSLLPWNSISTDVLNKINTSNIREGIAFYKYAKINQQKDYDFSDIESELNAMGYYLIQNKRINDGIEIFKLNTQEFPKSSNTYDSLAEAYLLSGDKRLALSNYKKALELDPKNDNARKIIEKLEKEK